MDRPIGSTENARTAREVVPVDPVTGAPLTAGQVTGVYNAPQIALTAGQRADVQLNLKGEMLVAVDQLSSGDGVSATLSSFHDRSGTSRPLSTGGYLFNGTSWDRQRGDMTAGAWTQGPAADNSPAVGNPIWGGAKYFSTTQAYSSGDVASLQANSSGHLLVGAEATPLADGLSTTITVMTDRNGAGRPLAVAAFDYNGSGWDRRRKPNGSSRIVSSAATTNATSAKAAAGDLRKVIGRNTSAGVIYLKMYNKSASPNVGTDVPILTLPLPPSSNFDFDLEAQYFSAGIAYALTAGVADNDTTAVAAGDVVGLNLTYS